MKEVIFKVGEKVVLFVTMRDDWDKLLASNTNEIIIRENEKPQQYEENVEIPTFLVKMQDTLHDAYFRLL